MRVQQTLLAALVGLLPAAAAASPDAGAPPPRRECAIYIVEKRTESSDVTIIQQGIKHRHREQLEVVVQSSMVLPQHSDAEAAEHCASRAAGLCPPDQRAAGFCRYAVHAGETPAWDAAQILAPEAPPKKAARKPSKKKPKKKATTPR